MRVLHVIASLSPVHGGTTTSCLQMVDGLQNLGLSVEIAASDDDGPGKRLEPQAAERSLPNRHYFAKDREFYSYAPSMGVWLDQNITQFDLVHVHGLFSHVNGLAGHFARKHTVPYVVTPHGMANSYSLGSKPWRKKISMALIERRLLNRAACVHLTSTAEARDFTALGLAASTQKIPLAVEAIAGGKSERFFERHPPLAHKKLILFMSRINPVKNLEVLIEAMSHLDDSFHLVVAGSGPDEYLGQLKAQSALLGLSDRISWLGFVSGINKADALEACDVFVLPSHSESFGIAAVEAISAGLPCVLSAKVAISDDLSSSGFAHVFDIGAEQLASCVREAEMHSRKQDNFKDKAREFVKGQFSGTKLSQDMADLYSSILDKRARGAL